MNNNMITLQIGWENEDFIKMKHTIIAEYKNIRVKFKIDDIINDDLKSRLVVFKAKKRFKEAIQTKSP